MTFFSEGRFGRNNSSKSLWCNITIRRSKLHYFLLSSGEAKWLIVSRGIMAAFIIIVIAIYTIFLVVVEPVRETALTPIRDSRTLGFPNDFPKKENIWNVVVVRHPHDMARTILVLIINFQGKPINKDSPAVDISPAVKVVYLNDDLAGGFDLLNFGDVYGEYTELKVLPTVLGHKTVP